MPKGIEEYGENGEILKQKDYKPELDDLLLTKKTIRDPVHKDIKINHIEVELMDTLDFQRLRYIKQLGPSYLVYPGLHHTRFEHSLGTLHMAQKMIDAINSNLSNERQIKDSYEIILIRLHALLHDLAHVPFGHTLEDEGKLYPSQWEDQRRIKRFLGPHSEIGKIIERRINDQCRKDLISILQAKKEEDIIKFRWPFVVDIVSNTICADLLDYLKRDIYFAGLEEAYDERFLKYLIIHESDSNPKNKSRVAFTLIGNKGKHIRRDNVSEILHLLRLRYSMAEKIYFHHAKTAASAMIISAIRAVQSEINDEELFNLGDDEFLMKIQEKNNEISNYILEKFKARQIYKMVYKHGYRAPEFGNYDDWNIGELQNIYRDPENRQKQERLLEKQSNLPGGSVIIHCPDPNMALKPAEARVLWMDNKIYKLEEVPDDHIKEEVKAIKENHRRLWQISVFLAPDYIETQEAKYVASDFEKEVGLKNDLSDFSENQESWEKRQLDQFVPKLENEMGIKVTYEEFKAIEKTLVSQEISSIKHPLTDNDGNILFEQIKSFLNDFRKVE